MKSGTNNQTSGAAKTVRVRVLAFNDLHGHIEGPSGSLMVKGQKVKAGGLDVMAGYVKAQRAAHPHVTTVVAGDLIGASPLISALFHDEPTILAMNQMGLDILAVGNHEFDEGVDELMRIKRGGCHPKDGCKGGRASYPGAKFDFLAANVVVKDTGKLLFPAYTIKEYDGAKVAYIGLTLEGTDKATNPAGITSVKFLNEVTTINKHVTALKKQGVKAFVIVIHEGAYPGKRPAGLNECSGMKGPILDIIKKLDPEVDAVVAGHTHQVFNCTVNGVLLTSAKSYGRVMTEIDLEIDPKTQQVVKKSATNVGMTRDRAKDPGMVKLVGDFSKAVGPLANQAVGAITKDLSRAQNEAGESVLGGMIADAQLAATKASGAQIAFMNPGGVRNNLLYKSSAANEGDGVVTYAEVHAVQPFGNMLKTITLTGAQLKALLEEQWKGSRPHVLSPSAGFAYTWDSSKPVGQRVVTMTLEGKAIDPAAKYRITVNGFLAAGGDGFTVLKQAEEGTGGPQDLDAFVQYLRGKKTHAPHKLGRITRR